MSEFIASLRKQSYNLEKEFQNRRFQLVFGLVISLLGFMTLWVGVSFWCALGVFLLLWANNMQTNSKPKL